MIDQTQLAYLDAMGIEVWVPRVDEPGKAAAEHGMPIQVFAPGPGMDSDILCVVENQSQAALRLAVDIGRAMRSEPIWTWPDYGEADGAKPMPLDDVLHDRMTTQALVFGSALAAQLLGEPPPDCIGAAKIHIVPSLDELAGDRDAKRILWALMREQGIAKKRR